MAMTVKTSPSLILGTVGFEPQGEAETMAVVAAAATAAVVNFMVVTGVVDRWY